MNPSTDRLLGEAAAKIERLRKALEFVVEWHDAGEDSQELIKVMVVVKWALEGKA